MSFASPRVNSVNHVKWTSKNPKYNIIFCWTKVHFFDNFKRLIFCHSLYFLASFVNKGKNGSICKEVRFTCLMCPLTFFLYFLTVKIPLFIQQLSSYQIRHWRYTQNCFWMIWIYYCGRRGSPKSDKPKR